MTDAPAAATALVLATHNPHKVDELRRILGADLGSLELVVYNGPEPIEDGVTFAENALIKARAAAVHTGLAALADDSGIAVDALGGAPGIHSARYAGTRRSEDNVALLLERMRGVQDRRAVFVCAAAAVLPDGSEHVEVAEWPGEVLEQPAGGGGFGYDPVFRPDGLAVSSAEISAAEKDAISHRRQAFSALLPWLRERLG
ncbi:MAG: rdgB [Naasia sp.]|uniref:RdgB/HAM1 family non-canonical purine NTP pyrophosphatase n=1 Tax=Naasia sp. TaxID=2546198 RepID=UPI00261489FA|nr:RdgB/HAM1 family non-canonical purine NTP pyrophosphatase [Naasia sp.]MCU1571520.1 rdgB [Naasia sp.]